MKVEASLTAEELMCLFLSPEFREELISALPKSPSEALCKITKHYGNRPNINGENMKSIIDFRNALYHLDSSGVFPNALVIMAPHTHWDDLAPTIIEKHHDVYLIGTKTPEETLRYSPVSFLLKGKEIIPYEWAASTVGIDLEDLEKCIKIIGEVASCVDTSDGLWAISLNFRFKDLFSSEFVPNIENPVEVPLNGYIEMSVIERIERQNKEPVNLLSEQVSWHLFSDLQYGLTEDEHTVLRIFRELVNNDLN